MRFSIRYFHIVPIKIWKFRFYKLQKRYANYHGKMVVAIMFIAKEEGGKQSPFFVF